LIHIGLALMAQVGFEEDRFGATPRLWLIMAALVVPHALGLLAHRLYLRGSFRVADRVFIALSWSPVIMQALALFAGGWTLMLERWTGHSMGLLGWPDGWVILSLAPFIVYSLLAIDARSRLGTASAERTRRTRHFQSRLFAVSLAPVLAYVLISWAIGSFALLRTEIETVSVWNATYAAAMLFVFAASVPWLLRNTWETEPMPGSVQRSTLESVAQAAKFDGRRLFIWRTGNSVANAAVIGLFPRHRVVLFSDLLLSQLDLRELAGVFAHEIGHAKKNHVLVFATWAFAALFGADLLASEIAPNDTLWNAVVMLGAMGIWAIGFGWMSRRFELEADMYSLRLIGDAEPLIGALEKVSGPHGRAKTSWRHFSTVRRIEFLQAMTREPGIGVRLERRLRGLTRAGAIAFLAVMILEGVGLAREWPRDRLMLDLRRGNYASAARRIEDHSVVNEGLAALVGRAASLRQGDVAEVERSARAALASGDFEALGQWLDLGSLRGDADMTKVRDLLSSLKPGTSDGEAAAIDAQGTAGTDELLARAPPAWRDALEPLLRAARH
jgi:Zn-dependent protease with chaperone function